VDRHQPNSSASLRTLLSLSCQCYKCQNFQYFGQYFELFWERFTLALHLVLVDKDLIRICLGSGFAKMMPIRPDPDPQHYVGQADVRNDV
jgi:hypothetical protein